MSTIQVLRSRFPRAVARGQGVVTAPAKFLDSVGHVAWFVVTCADRKLMMIATAYSGMMTMKPAMIRVDTR